MGCRVPEKQLAQCDGRGAVCKITHARASQRSASAADSIAPQASTAAADAPWASAGAPPSGEVPRASLLALARAFLAFFLQRRSHVIAARSMPADGRTHLSCAAAAAAASASTSASRL